MDPVRRPHDALFRLVFGEPENAAGLLRRALPPALAGAIDWRSLRRQDGSFVDAQLRPQQADLLFEARIGDERALLYLLVEHKATEERLTAFQVLRYVVRVLERWLREHPGASDLPPVLPFVVHHGDGPWHGPRRVRDLVRLDGLPPAARRSLRALQPDLRFALDDLAAQSEPEIQERMLSSVSTIALLFLRVLPAATSTRLSPRSLAGRRCSIRSSPTFAIRRSSPLYTPTCSPPPELRRTSSARPSSATCPSSRTP